MKDLFLFVFALFFCINSNAQITSADTACVGDPVIFTGPSESMSSVWLKDTIDFNQTPAPIVNANVSGLNISAYSTLNYDNGTWYSFITNTGNAKITRLTFNGNPNGSFTQSDIGTYGTVVQYEGMGIDILKDTATGNWYGFVVNDKKVYRLDFGTSLANTPTSTSFTVSVLDWPHQISIAKFGTQWIGFVGNRTTHATIVRLDFGTSITNTPTATSLPNVGTPPFNPYIYQPANFALHQEGGNWYMLVANFGGNSITRYNFGSNIQNNNPTGVYLGTFNTMIDRPRTIMLLQDGTHLIAYVLNETSDIWKLNFNGSILNTPTKSLGMSPAQPNKMSMLPYFADSSMYIALVTNNQHLYRSKFLTLPSFDTTYYNNMFAESFATGGMKKITLLTNTGNAMGGKVFTKNIFVVETDTSISASGNDLTANDTAASYQWIDCANNQSISGATSRNFTPTMTGSYAVALNKNGCLDTSNCRTVTVVGVNDINKTIASVYPNPTTGDVSIQLDHSYSTVKVRITSAIGQLVSVKEYKNTQLIHTAIDGAGGLYYLQVIIDGKAATHAIVTKQ